jgi:hypothetical protein
MAVINPLFVVTSTVPPDPDVGGAYCLELRNQDEETLDRRCFDLAFNHGETGEPTQTDWFSLALPYPSGTQEVVLTYEGQEIERVASSLNPPQVELLSPNGGEIWESTSTYTVTWIGSDPDGEQLHYALSVSPDGGVTWNPLVLDTTETQWVVDPQRLPGSENSKIRVEVSDGFNIGVDSSNTVFTIKTKVPQVIILAPAAEASVSSAIPLLLQGYA